MSTHDKMIVSWAEGKANNLASSKNKTGSWASLRKILSSPVVTGERRKDFDKMSKDEQDVLKATNGWISGAQCKDNHRSLKNVLPRDLLTLDIDYPRANLLDLITEGFLKVSHFEGFWHSSRRHTEEAPRVRLFAPMSRKVSLEEYLPIARYVAFLIDAEMKTVDPVSFRGAQMMFKPSCSKDDRAIFFTHHQEGDLIDPDEILERFNQQFGDWTDISTWPRHPDEELRKRAEKAEDPRVKRPPVGTFCRAYSIEAAMEKFIPGVYIPGDQHSGNPRYTYSGSTSSNGAVVYDDGLFLYSNHGSDPLSDQLVNAWDMVRVHLFGKLDEKVKGDDTPIAKMPSFKAMMEHVQSDKGYKRQLAEDKYDTASMFDGEVDEDWSQDEPEPDDDSGDSEPGAEADETFEDIFEDLVGGFSAGEHSDSSGETASSDGQHRPRPKPSQPRKPKKDWFPDDLEMTPTGDIASNLHNVATIIQNDVRMAGVIRYNEFSNNVVAVKNIRGTDTTPAFHCKDRVNGDRWQDHNDIAIRAILAAPNGPGKTGYGLNVTDRDLTGAVELAARLNAFHPVKDYLLRLKWDRKKRVDSFFVRHLGTPDDSYHREVARLMLVASVTRMFEPGHKFDFAAIIEGPQGVRKSSLIRTLYGSHLFGELHCDLGDKQQVAEEITGKWGVELPELSSLHKADHNAAKAFMRRQHDDVRMAYARRLSEFPRQCVCWGTTNDRKYLKDDTGNRSYLPVKVYLSMIDTDAIEAERDQLWAEAVEIYFQMRDEKPTGELFLALGQDAEKIAQGLQENARVEATHELWAQEISYWVNEPLTLAQLKAEYGSMDNTSFRGLQDDNEDDEKIMVVRCAYRINDAIIHVLKKNHGLSTDHSTTQNVSKAASMVPGFAEKAEPVARRLFKTVGRWITRLDATPEELRTGYRVIPEDDVSDLI